MRKEIDKVAAHAAHATNDEGQALPNLTRRTFMRAFAGGLLVSFVGGASAGLTGCSGAKDAADSAILGVRTVTDHAGREVSIPTAQNIKNVFFTSSLAQVYITCLCPDLLAGTASKFEDRSLPYLPEGVNKLPYLGTLHNNGEIDREQLLKQDIDIMFSISGIELTQQNISEAIEIQDQTRIPVLLVDGSFDVIPDAFRFLGDILGRPDRAEELATFCGEFYERVHKVVQTIPESERIGVYYAEGPEGLQTEPETSQHMLGFLEGGAKCVAKCKETYGGGMTDVSLEQVIKWDPEVIVGWDVDTRGGAVDDIRTNKNWANITAVKNSRVYAMPNEPWAWCDRPPGVNRLIGIHWVANLLYPQYYDVDMVEVTQEYFKTMYNVEPSREEVEKMLGNSYTKKA